MKNLLQKLERAHIPLLILTAGTVLVSLFFHPLHPDEKVFGTIANGILEGKLPYRDLFDNKPPGIHSILAGVFYLFGTSMWVFRGIVVVAIVVSAAIMYFLIKEIYKIKDVSGTLRGGEELVGALLFITLLPVVHGTYALTELFSLPFIILSVYMVVRHKKGNWFIAVSGLLFGISLLFKQTNLFFIFAICFGIVLYSSKLSIFQKSKRVFIFLLFSIVPIGIAALYMYRLGILNDALQDVLWFNILDYPPIISQDTLKVIAFVIISLPVYWIFLYQFIQSKTVDHRIKQIALLTILLLLPTLLYRPYHHYWIYIVPLLIIFAGLRAREIKWGYNLLVFNSILVVVFYGFYTYRTTTAVLSNHFQRLSNCPLEYAR